MAAATLRLLADIGGTNCRFALADAEGAITARETYPLAAFGRFEDALAAYLERRPQPAEAALAAAGPMARGVIRLTNAPWIIDRRAISAALGGAPVALLNDLEAVALALPHLGVGDVGVVAEGRVSGGRAPLLALNAGTGLGAALAIPTPPDGWRSLSAEPGHMRFAAALPEESRIAEAAATYEDALAGRGHRLLSALFPNPAERRRVYSGLLGRVAGDLVLATGAWGGVFLTGGVLQAWADNVNPVSLLDQFVDKGPMAERMAAVPIYRIVKAAPAMTGLAHAPVD